MKTCTKCKVEKPLHRYNKRGLTKYGKQRYHSHCKDCVNIRSKTWQRNRNPVERRRATIKYKYGIDYDQYLSMYAAQNGECAICHIHKEMLDIDHDHKTQKIRGLLCHNCNMGIGSFGDSVYLLERASMYLERII